MTTRQTYRNKSNNNDNSNKNVCALAVATALGVEKSTRYLHTLTDIVKAARSKFKVRSRLSNVKDKTVGAARKTLIKLASNIANDNLVYGFIVMVDGHVLLLDSEAKTFVDTDPRQRDKRKIKACYVVYQEINRTQLDSIVAKIMAKRNK